MKNALHIILLAILTSCASKTVVKNGGETVVEENIEREEIVPDTLTSNPKLELTAITVNDFSKYKKRYKTNCAIDKDGVIAGQGLKLETECHEICVSQLIENGGHKMMMLPSSYDQGIINILFSPSCDMFFVFSSYDGPDYANYYAHRAELIVFTLKPGGGLKSVKQYPTHNFDDFSIEDATWIDDKTIAVKVYEGAAGGDNSHLQFKYYKAAF